MPTFIVRSLVFLLVAGLAAPLLADTKTAKRDPYEQIEDVPGLPRVLLIGDSISIAYTLQVRDNLKGIANVHRPPTNCSSTKQGLEHIDQWLGDDKWDVIHFNWGLHDLKHVKGDNSATIADIRDPLSHMQVPVDQYMINLEKLVTRLEQTGATLIWRNTTPVPVEGSNGRIPGYAAKYNNAALLVLKNHPDVIVDDMWTLVKPNQDKWKSSKGNVHFNSTANEVLGKHVAEVIQKALPKQ